MRFSIVTPVYVSEETRAEQLTRCIESVKNQDFDHGEFEHIIVNDGSTSPVSVPKYPWLVVINQENLQRITAFNNGLKKATGEVILFLDSDDEFEGKCLSSIQSAFQNFPEYKMFNFGCIRMWRDGTIEKRTPFVPKELEVGHEVFGGGNIVNGTFVFKREIYESLGAFPEHHIENIDCTEIGYGEGPRELYMTSPWDFSAYAQMEFPEIRPFFQEKHPDHPKGLVRELGNPFGNDYYLFFKYTRKFKSKPINEYILRVYMK